MPRNANILTRVTMLCQRLERPPRTLLAPLSQIQRSMCSAVVSVQVADGSCAHSIPHASSGNGHNGHQGLSISPTNSTSPVNKESSLAHENTNVEEETPVQQDTEAKADTEPAFEAESAEPVIETIIAEATIVEIKTID